MSQFTNPPKLLETDPGDEIFVQYAESLKKEGKRVEALNVILRGLTASPTNNRGRLLLARMFYEDGYTPFAVRELIEIHKSIPQNKAIKQLLEKLSPGIVNSLDIKEGQVVGESEFDFAEIEVLGEEEEK